MRVRLPPESLFDVTGIRSLFVSAVRLYRHLGQAMRLHKALADAVARWTIGVAHFQVAVSLLAKTRRRQA